MYQLKPQSGVCVALSYLWLFNHIIILKVNIHTSSVMSHLKPVSITGKQLVHCDCICSKQHLSCIMCMVIRNCLIKGYIKGQHLNLCFTHIGLYINEHVWSFPHAIRLYILNMVCENDFQIIVEFGKFIIGIHVLIFQLPKKYISFMSCEPCFSTVMDNLEPHCNIIYSFLKL